MPKKILATALALVPLIAGATGYQVVDRPRQECWNEQVPVRAAQDYSGAILGGIAGGILGNQVGGGNGRTVATAAGAMAGAVTGDRMASQRPAYQTVQRCRTVVDHVRMPMAEPEPQPMYQAPAPIYVPQPVYVQPAPVVVQTGYGYYAVPPEPVYYRQGGRGHWRGYRHHRHDDDD